MTLKLPPQLEEAIRRKVESGMYASTADMLAQALELLEEHEQLRAIRLQKLREQVQVGLDQAERGESSKLDIEQVIEKARQQRRQMRRESA